MNLTGSLCALATPFRAQSSRARDERARADFEDDALDVDAYGRLIDYQLDGGTRGLIVAGSTGEAAALDEAEFTTLIDVAVRRVRGRVPILVGTGMQSTRKTILQTRRARDAGADAALVVAPAYVRPTQEGLFRHFSEVADRGGLPVVLYNVPSRTACDLLPETVARLVDHGNIVGVKEARPEAERMQALLAFRSENFRVLSGDDPTCSRAIRAGADGVISVAANVAPRALQSLCEASADGRVDVAARLDADLQRLYALLGVEPNPIPVKACLARLGIGSDRMRLPLVALGAEHRDEVDAVLSALGLLEDARVSA